MAKRKNESRAALDPESRTQAHGKTLMERFMSKVEFRQDGHWIWTGASKSRRDGTQARGSFCLGIVSAAGYSLPSSAHEVSYRMFRGPIPAGHQLACCEVKLCVHPDHVLCLPRHFAGDRATLEKAPAIRREYRRRKKLQVVEQTLADEYGVTRQAINFALAGKIKGKFGKLAGKVDEIRARYTGRATVADVARDAGVKEKIAYDIVTCQTYRF